MAFDNLNYSTETNDENSIQDQIDRIHSTTKSELAQLQADILGRLQTVQVDIFDQGSYLKIRDKDGTIKKEKALNNEELTVLTDHVMGPNNKVFIHIKTKKGVKGYVSADYVKIKKVTSTPSAVPAPAIPVVPSAPVAHSSTPITPSTIDENLPAQDSPTSTPAAPAAPTPMNNSDSSEVASISEKHMIFKDGRVFLIGEDGSELEQTMELTPEYKEIIKGYETVGILNEIITIWKDQAHKVANSLYWKDSRDTDELIIAQTKNVDDYFLAIMKNIGERNMNFKQEIDSIFKAIQVTEGNKNIIGTDDMREVKRLLLSEGSKDQKLMQIYNTMRYGGWSGNSIDVKERVAEHLLASADFINISNILKNPQVIEYIKNNNEAELMKLLGNNKDLADSVIKSYSKIKAKQEQHREEYAQALAPINKKRLEDGEDEISLNDFIELNVTTSINVLLKHTLIEEQIAKMKNRGGSDTYTGIYADMSGLAETETWDWADIGDDNIDTAIDVGSTLALSIVSMGVGALAARAAIGVASWGARASGVANTFNNLSKFKTAAEIGKFSSIATIEGFTFYEGTTITQNLIYGNNDWNEGTRNGKEILKSIAFMGVLRGAGKVMEKLGKISAIQNLSSKVPNAMLKTASISTILAEAGLLTGTSVGLEVLFEGEGNWTWEEYLQALVMVGVFRLAGKITFRKNSKGEATVTETVIPSGGEIYTNRRKQYSKNSDGSFTSIETGKLYKGRVENLKKVENNESNSKKEEPVKEEQGVENTISYWAHKQFKRLFNNHFSGEQSELKIKLGEDSLNIKKRNDGKFEISGNSAIFSKSELFKEMKNNYQKFEGEYLKKEAMNSAKGFRDKEIINTTKKYSLLPTERIGKDGLQIKENGKWRKANESELEAFWNKNQNVVKVLEARIEEIKLDDILTTKGKEWLNAHGGMKAYASKFVKDLLLNKWNLGGAAIFSIADIMYDREKDNGERTMDFIETLALGYAFGTLIKIGGIVYNLGAGTTKLSAGLAGKIFKYGWKHKGKILIAGVGGFVGYTLFFADESPEKK